MTIENKQFSVTLIFAIILGFTSLLLYANTLNNGFVLDDYAAIVQNKIVIKGASSIPELFTTPYRLGFSAVSNNLYRPLSLILFSIEYQFFGLNPQVFHLVSIILFAVCVILLFFTLNSIFLNKKPNVAFIAALLFSAHPIHTEAVANIKSGDELLCFLFAFLSLFLFIKYNKTGKIFQLIVGTVCFFLSLLSKETGITFLAVFPLIFFWYLNENRKRAIYITVCSIIVAIIFLLIRYKVLTSFNTDTIGNVAFIDNALALPNLAFESRLATAVVILGWYIKLLFFPYPLICDYSYNTIPFYHYYSLWFIISLLIYLSIAFYGVKRLLKNHKDPYAFAFLYYLITISIVSNILFLIGTTMGERLLFFSSTGFCLLVALVLDKLLHIESNGKRFLKQPMAMAIVFSITTVFAIITIFRNQDWKDNITLYTSDIAKSPNSARLNYYLGLELGKQTLNEKDPKQVKEIRTNALEYLKQSVNIVPNYGDAQTALGTTYAFLLQFDSAEVHVRKAYEIYPYDIKTISNLAFIYFSSKKYQKSIEFSKKAIDLNKSFIGAYINIGNCYLNLGKNDSGIIMLQKAISIDCSNLAPYISLAQYYKVIGQPDSLKKYQELIKKYSR